ncbi:helix-turn-helix transcriptional regulator [Halocynthiibacter sp. C4]|uniref:helix-turn-helix transcriptional regulator n=1 Tax=Halocynthiibacter sp. C4 TaxID=2992758 RepID=UPI00237A744E|nr:helix-turn-helix transcriptional regulator [Halocynthiibacter sp. C4]
MNNLSHYRELRGLNQRELAELINVSQPTIQRAETEDPSAKLGTYKACAEALGVTLSQIFSDRSEVEDQVLTLFKSIPEAKRDEIFTILRLARTEPTEPTE